MQSGVPQQLVIDFPQVWMSNNKKKINVKVLHLKKQNDMENEDWILKS